MAQSTTQAGQVERVNLKKLLWVGPLAVILSTVANVLVRMATLAVLDVHPDFMPLTAPTVVPFTIIGTGMGVVVFALMARFGRRPIRNFRIVAAVVLVLSFVPDIALLASGMPGATVATVSVLMLMHVIAAAITVGMVTTLTRE